MASVSRPIDVSDVDTSSTYDMIPVGVYDVVISTSDEDENKKQNGRFIMLEFTIGKGQFSGKTIRTWINYQHTSAKAQELGLKLLKKIMDAIKVPSPLKDTAQLHNKPLKIKIGIDGTYNVVEDVFPYAASAGDLYSEKPAEEQADAFGDLEEPDWKK